MKLGDHVIHTPDGREGTIITSMIVKHLNQRDDESRFVVEYKDQMGNLSQTWFDEASLKLVK